MVRDKLLATSGITSLVSTRVYVDGIPSSPTFPCISVHLTSDVPNGEVGKLNEVRVQVSCWDNPPRAEGGLRSPVNVEALSAAVKTALHKPIHSDTRVERWTVTGVGSYDIIKRTVTGGTMVPHPLDWYHIPRDVLISFTEV